jgi:hypothetical protein
MNSGIVIDKCPTFHNETNRGHHNWNSENKEYRSFLILVTLITNYLDYKGMSKHRFSQTVVIIKKPISNLSHWKIINK